MDRLSLLLVALAASSCTTPNAVLITVKADAKVEQYDLYVREDSTSQIVFHSGFNPVQTPSEKPRDLTNDGLKIALKIAKPGSYTFQMIGVTSDPENGKPAANTEWQFWADRVRVDGTVEISARLLTVSIGDDADGDLWPETNAFIMHNPGASAIYGKHHELLDCDDDPNSMPLDNMGNPIKYKASDINPFAVEICGNGYDEDCDGHDTPCVDHDKDGESSITDCDDNDPKRHHPTAMDPFPDPPNCCGYNLGKKGTADEFTDFLHPSPDPNCFAVSCMHDKTLCPMQRCGDGIDESCQGKDTNCIIDADCDGDPAPPIGNDCDDHDPAVHSGALEPCGSTKDLNCDGIINGGCVPCDLDGDGFERNDPPNGCPDNKDKHPGMVDCNDYDSAVFPGATKDAGGTEGGKTAIGRLNASLAQFCRRVYEPTGMTGTAKVAALGWLVGDMDCNGTAFEGCPPANCDQDGDGFPTNANGCTDPDGKYDCDDTNPTIYPGAPVSCGTGPAENCTDQKQPCDQDADHDGWNAGVDCDDGDATVHPWAVELCDGKDNDCDKLVDEGNPDVKGNPLVAGGAVTSCTDNNVGECGKTKGVCVCAIALPMSKTNPADRVICPTEDSGTAKPPHCFGAGQPHPQSCDSCNPKDDDCNGSDDDAAGMNLAIKGQPCGINGPGMLGQCKQGVIVGCDSKQTNCFAQFGRVSNCQSWYVCSTDAVCPQAELCNGLDDDCDGTLAGTMMSNPMLSMIPANDEIDHDGDQYLACSTCSGLTLASGILGCGDCNDTNKNVHPNAKELCDNIDNKCDPNWAASPGGTDGADECVGTTCCSGQPACRNLKTDFQNCATCGNVCDVIRANQCGALGCQCGNAVACTGQNYCNGGSCAPCTVNPHCGPTCVDCTGSGSVCKTDGSACTGCNGDADCASKPGKPYCNGGTCLATKPSDGMHMCATGPECTTGFCADTYCCDKACSGGCDVCNSTPGMCTIVPKAAMSTGANPSCGAYICNGSSAACLTNCASSADCTTGYTCVNPGATGVCKKIDGQGCNSGTECANNNCVLNICCNMPCNGGSPSCSNSTGQTTNYVCTTGSCQTSITDCMGRVCNGNVCSVGGCTSDSGCTGQTFCNSVGNCQGRKAVGQSCQDPDCKMAPCRECSNMGGASATCVDGACCQTSSCSTCQTCASGNCANITNAPDPDTCAGPNNTCNGSSQCRINDGYSCAVGTCLNGNCVNHTGSGTVCCHTACTVGFTCNGGSTGTQVVNTNCDNGTCGSSNTPCTGTTYCSNGACTSCTADAFCSNGSSCQDCTGSTTVGHHCLNPGTGTPCGCSADAHCVGVTGKPYCYMGACVANKPDGASCPTTMNAECTNGHCISNGAGGFVCCNNACAPGTSCNSSTQQSVTTATSCTTGTCTPTNTNCGTGYICGAGPAGGCSVSCTCGGPTTCNNSTQCDNSAYYCNTGACVLYDPGHCGTGQANCPGDTTTGFLGNLCRTNVCGCGGLADCSTGGRSRGTCQSNQCKCGAGTACASTSCCNSNSTCATNDSTTGCGTTCQDCTSAPDGTICTGSTKHCGCSSFATDCNATLSDACDSTNKVCTCKGAAACTGGQTCQASGCK
jgi:hypothetical protein